MLKFIRTVDKSLEDFLVLDLKTLSNLADNVYDHSPIRSVMVSSAEFPGHFTGRVRL